MTVFSKLWNANAPSVSESKSSTRTVVTGQFCDDNVGSMTTAPNKHWCGATSKLMKGALIIAGVTGTSWVVGKAVGSAKANNTAVLLLKEASIKATKAAKTGSPKAKAGKGGGKVSYESQYVRNLCSATILINTSIAGLPITNFYLLTFCVGPSLPKYN